jgi:hypothetical protein
MGRKVMIFLAVLLLEACTTTRTVTVPQVHTVTVHQIDTVYKTDSVKEIHNTIVREADSAMMAQYGIRLGKLEKAYLINQVSDRQKTSSKDRIFYRDSVVHDSVPVPYPKVEYKEKKLSARQKAFILKGKVTFTLIFLLIAYMLSIYILSQKK